MNDKHNLKIITLLSAICFCGMNAYAQLAGGAIMAVDERNLGGGGRMNIEQPAKAVSTQTPRTTQKTTANKKAADKKVADKKVSSAKTTPADSAKTSQTTYKKATPKPRPPKKYDGFTIGSDDFLFNFEIVQYVQPVHTIKAQEAGAKGLVQVEILIDVDGSVLQARARSGNKLLHPEAEKAALMTKFRKFSVYGKPARAFGFIVFRFGKREDD